MKITRKVAKFFSNLFRQEKGDGEESERPNDHTKSAVPDVEPSRKLSVDNSPVSFTIPQFKSLLQELYDTEQQRTDPWIKLGIDFGTSSSKVVWRGRSDAFPVCFGGSRERIDSYLFPSEIYLNDGRVYSGFDISESEKHDILSNFKMCLACSSSKSTTCGLAKCSLNAGWKDDLLPEAVVNDEAGFVSAVFLAQLLAKARKLIIDKLAAEFRESPCPKWTANLSVPETFIELSPVAEKFREVFRISWLMANVFHRWEDFGDLKAVTNCYLAARDMACESLEVLDDVTFGCAVYPEVGAEVASIVLNKNSEEGLYAFVDIGAGTVDASLFNYFRDGPKANRPPFATDISKKLGAGHIENYASRLGPKSGLGMFSSANLKTIKERLNSMTSSEKSTVEPQRQLLRAVARQIGKQTEKFLIEVFRAARDKKFPGIVNERIRVVVGGGGAALKTYRSAAETAFSSKGSIQTRKPEMATLAKPVEFQMSPLPSSDFHRFAVAYGLSYSIEDLPEPILCRDVEMIARPKPRDWSFNPLYD